jgi:hypothetical protein
MLECWETESTTIAFLIKRKEKSAGVVMLQNLSLFHRRAEIGIILHPDFFSRTRGRVHYPVSLFSQVNILLFLLKLSIGYC